MSVSRPFFLPVLCGVMCSGAPLSAQRLYYADANDGELRRIERDGSAGETLVSTGEPVGLALDFENGKIYWSNSSGVDQILRANLDGSDPEILVTDDLLAPQDLAIDPIHRKLYWTDLNLNNVKRSELDGSDVTVIFQGTDHLRGIAVDPLGEKLYFCSHQGVIYRCDLDGSALEEFVTSVHIPHGIHVDSGRQRLYWTAENGRVERIDLDGTSRELLEVFDPNEYANDVAVDRDDEWIYFSVSESHRVTRRLLAGGPFQDIASGNYPAFLQLDDPTDLGCVEGNVNAGIGATVPVLLLNGASGVGPDGVVEYGVLESVTITMDRPPAVPPGQSAPFALYGWTATPTEQRWVAPLGIGLFCLPPPGSGGSPEPRIVWNNAAHQAVLGIPNRASQPAPSTVAHRPGPLPRAVRIFLQGIVFDPGSGRNVPASVTNGILAVPVF